MKPMKDKVVEKINGSLDNNSHMSQVQRKEKNRECFWDDVRSHVHKLALLSGGQRDALCRVLYENREIMETNLIGTNIYEHSIKLNTKKPFIYKSYPVPIHYRVLVESEIDRLLKQRIIEKSDSEFCNSLRIVKKTNGQIRVCFDARMLNKYIEMDNESSSLINEILQKHEGVQYMISLDMRNGYWQISLDKNSRKFTAFIHNGSVYHFCRVPFGLKTAGSAFMRAIRNALDNSFDSFTTVYIDDIY